MAAGLPLAALICVDLPLAAFDSGCLPGSFGCNPTAAVRVMGQTDGAASLVGRRIGGRWEGINNPHDLWFDRTAFVVPDQYTFGNSGAGILRADHQWNVDASLFKKFTVGGGNTLEFRVEAFNLLNSVYFSAPSAQIDTASVGKVTSTSNQPRQMQLGFKYLF